MKYCKRCGSPMDDGASFCPECGTKAEASSNPMTGTPPNQSVPDGNSDVPPASNKKSRKPLVAIALLGVVAVALVLVFVLVLLPKGNGGSFSASVKTGGASATSSSQSDAGSKEAEAQKKAEEEKAQKAQEEAAAKKKAEEEAAKKAQEEAEAQRKAEEKAAQQEAARAQAKVDAYNAVIDQAGNYESYALVDISGDDVPELILHGVHNAQQASYVDYPVYMYNEDSGSCAEIGKLSLHVFRGSLGYALGEHALYVLESHGENQYYPMREVVQGGELVSDANVGIFNSEDEVSAAGIEPITWYDLGDRSPIEAL